MSGVLDREPSPQRHTLSQSGPLWRTLPPALPGFGPLRPERAQRLRASFRVWAGADPRQGRSPPGSPALSAGTPHLGATSTRLLRAFPRKVPLRGPGRRLFQAQASTEEVGGGGVVRAAFFRQPPNGLHFQIVKLEMGPHPINFILGGGANISQVCFTATCTTKGFGNRCNPKSSKAKGPSEFSKESRIGGGAVEQGSRERKQKPPAQRGTPPPPAKGVRPELGPRVQSSGGRRGEPWSRPGCRRGGNFVLGGRFGLGVQGLRGPLFDGWPSFRALMPLHPLFCRSRA